MLQKKLKLILQKICKICTYYYCSTTHLFLGAVGLGGMLGDKLNIQMPWSWETNVSPLQEVRFQKTGARVPETAGEVWVREEKDLSVLLAMGRQRRE